LIRAVLFDAVGTLIELREPVGETYSRAVADHGVKVSSRRIGQAFGRVVAKAEPLVFPGAEPALLPALERDWWRRVVRDTLRASASACPVADLDACFEDLWRHYASPAAWRLREGAAEILSRLRTRGLRLAVVSNFDGRLPALLEGLEIAALLDSVVLPSDAGAAKPDARIFDTALRRLEVAPAEALFVGDDAHHDLAGARGAGLEAVDVATLATLRDLQVP
jgi:putative hydrolase of the HAD superfamily